MTLSTATDLTTSMSTTNIAATVETTTITGDPGENTDTLPEHSARYDNRGYHIQCD